MSHLIQSANFSASGSASAIGFEGGWTGTKTLHDRYLLLNGERAFHVGVACDTCQFVFQRLEGADDKVSPAAVGARLREGVSILDDDLLQGIGAVFPEGSYQALLVELTPELVRPGGDRDYFTHESVELWGIDAFWGLPDDPRTEYYRAGDGPLGDGERRFEFVVPMMPSGWLEPATVEAYERRLAGGERPTALAVSLLDVRGPAVWEGEREVTTYACLAHYLLDGHHKTFAAARTGTPITMLSFLAVEESVAADEDVARVLGGLAAA